MASEGQHEIEAANQRLAAARAQASLAVNAQQTAADMKNYASTNVETTQKFHEDAQKKFDAFQKELAELENRIAAMKSQSASAADALQMAKVTAEKASTTLETAKNNLNAADLQMQNIQNEVDEAETCLRDVEKKRSMARVKVETEDDLNAETDEEPDNEAHPISEVNVEADDEDNAEDIIASDAKENDTKRRKVSLSPDHLSNSVGASNDSPLNSVAATSHQTTHQQEQPASISGRASPDKDKSIPKGAATAANSQVLSSITLLGASTNRFVNGTYRLSPDMRFNGKVTFVKEDLTNNSDTQVAIVFRGGSWYIGSGATFRYPTTMYYKSPRDYSNIPPLHTSSWKATKYARGSPPRFQANRSSFEIIVEGCGELGANGQYVLYTQTDDGYPQYFKEGQRFYPFRGFSIRHGWYNGKSCWFLKRGSRDIYRADISLSTNNADQPPADGWTVCCEDSVAPVPVLKC